MGIIKFIAANILTILLEWIGIIYALIRSLSLKGLDNYFDSFAEMKDRTGNVSMSYLFNDILIKKGGYPFGTSDTTISNVLNKNKGMDTLTVIGKFVCKVLVKLKDPAIIN